MQGLESTSKSEIVPPTHLGVSNSLRHRKSLEEKRQTERRMMMLLPLGSTRREIIQRRRSWVRYACYADDGRTYSRNCQSRSGRNKDSICGDAMRGGKDATVERAADRAERGLEFLLHNRALMEAKRFANKSKE